MMQLGLRKIEFILRKSGGSAGNKSAGNKTLTYEINQIRRAW